MSKVLKGNTHPPLINVLNNPPDKKWMLSSEFIKQELYLYY